MEYGLGMVLSGGGSRGLAHVGVLKALAEEGVEPDCLSATSAGAIVAALYAAGYSPEAMLEFFETKHPFRVSNLALRKKVFITATDIVDGRLEIFTSGRLIPAVLASSSAPLVFTPTEIDGRLFSDGGVIDNFPVDPLYGLCSTILGVYASPLLRRDRSELKSTLAVSIRALEVGMYYRSRDKFHQCDYLICPRELARFGNFDTRHYGEILEIGYRAARDKMPEILGLLERARA